MVGIKMLNKTSSYCFVLQLRFPHDLKGKKAVSWKGFFKNSIRKKIACKVHRKTPLLGSFFK